MLLGMRLCSRASALAGCTRASVAVDTCLHADRSYETATATAARTSR